jgi:hypothetical protein
MEPDPKGSKAADDRRRVLALSRAQAVDARQVQLFAKALVGLGLTEYSPLVAERNRPTRKSPPGMSS